jgi:hypothetical protein
LAFVASASSSDRSSETCRPTTTSGSGASCPSSSAFAAIIAVFALVNAFFLMVAYAGSGAGLVQALMPALILWYLNTDEVKGAFGMANASGGPPPSA